MGVGGSARAQEGRGATVKMEATEEPQLVEEGEDRKGVMGYLVHVYCLYIFGSGYIWLVSLCPY